MKKIIIISLIVMMALALMLTGCTKTEVADDSDTTADTTDDATVDTTVDVVTTASLVTEPAALKDALDENGTWLIAALTDITTDEDLVMAGEFYDKNDDTMDLYRKLALYAQDENYKVTERYTLDAPKITITSPNAKIQGGTFKGDVYVQANGFTVQDATIDGNVYFASEEYKDSFILPTEEGKIGTVTGTIEVE